eukprot:gnl/TRDRNA2_/TRDRNA2_37227_c0_seq1.p2 gnl/TRDRNA2_/TRDRNA2_37227_c0~~gnl/TRDRNA2_/TRDRNA2_37227_c0_seq1.p2  ORF type:complete len:135 (-),score=1.25 gnl/TRDRNA2_/TRDRNA2_37227_c0_seq1:1028-1432(-)
MLPSPDPSDRHHGPQEALVRPIERADQATAPASTAGVPHIGTGAQAGACNVFGAIRAVSTVSSRHNMHSSGGTPGAGAQQRGDEPGKLQGGGQAQRAVHAVCSAPAVVYSPACTAMRKSSLPQRSVPEHYAPIA